MHAALDSGAAAVRPCGGGYSNGIWHEGPGDIEVRRPSDHPPYVQIPDADAEGVDQAVRTAQNALKDSGWNTRAPRSR